jgi:hypothetical protein
MKKLLIILPLILSGCATQTKNVKVIVSPTKVQEYNLTINDGDKMLCDPSGCRVLQ